MRISTSISELLEGRAELILLQGKRSESGIEIEVQPPERSFRIMPLGGERAFTAIVAFAILRLNPTPFVYLTRLKPFDDANVYVVQY